MESNLTALRVAKETGFGVAPANPVYKEVRRTSDALSFTPTNEVSAEIESSRQVTDLINTGRDSGGDMAMEHSIENMDVFLEGLFCNAWNRSPEVMNGAHWEYGASATRITGVTVATGTATVALAANSVLAGSTINSTGTAFVVGHLVRNTGYSDAANNGSYRVSASAAGSFSFVGGAAETPPATARSKVVGFEGAAGDIVATITGGSALTSTALNFTTLGLMVGQWVKIGGGGTYGFDTSANNGFARISAITATRLSFDITQGVFAADAGAGKTIRVFFGDTIRNGVAQFTYRIEKQYTLANNAIRYSYGSGQQPSALTLTAETRGVVTETLTWLGADLTAPAAARDAGATTEPISTNAVLDASNSVPMIMEAGAPLGAPNYVSGFAFTLDNGLRARNAIGSAGAIGIGLGRASITGTLTTYFGDEALLNKLRDGVASGATIAFRDGANNTGEIWDIPRLKYTSGFPDVPGIDADLTTALGFQALRDLANGRDYTVLLSRFDYLV